VAFRCSGATAIPCNSMNVGLDEFSERTRKRLMVRFIIDIVDAVTDIADRRECDSRHLCVIGV